MKKIITTFILSLAMCLSMPYIAAAQTTTADAPMSARDSLKALREQEQAKYDEQNASSQWLLWLVVGSGLLYAGYRYYRSHRSVIVGIIQAFTDGFRTKGDVTTPESKKILAGAIYALQQGAYLNTIKVDIGDKLHTILRDWWGISGRDSAIEQLDYLRNKGYAYYFPTVYKAAMAGSDEERKSIIIAAMTTQEDAEKAYSQSFNLSNTIARLKELNIVKHADEIAARGVVGWDAGRLIFVARLCCEAKYISEAVAWDYIDSAYEQAQKAFDSWDDLAKSYLIGRFIWGGLDVVDDGMNDLANDLLNKPKSPWRQVAWK
jgi:hypothetical protein